MATLREIFETDFGAGKRHLRVQGGGKEYEAFQWISAHAIWLAYYLGNCTNLPELLPGLLLHSLALGEDRQSIMKMGHQGESRFGMQNVFSRIVYLYIENPLSAEVETLLTALCDELNIEVRVRGKEYRDFRVEQERPLAFISHDSRDKDDVARPLATALVAKNRCPVWYDEFTLKPGDRLRDSIEKGLKECKKCIVVLSKNFLSNTGWTKKEFDGIFTREIVKREHVIIPVWHDISSEDVFEYSPSLLDIVGINTSEGIDVIAAKLARVIRSD